MRKIKNSLLILVLGILIFGCSSDSKGQKCEGHDKKGEHKRGHHSDHHKGDFHGNGFRSMNADSMAKYRTEFMKKELSLTDEQTPKVEALNLKYAQKMKELREQMKGLENERERELSNILTKEQVEKLNENKREHFHKERKH